MLSQQNGDLLAVLHSPPSRSSGQRTLGRVELARRALRCESARVSNLCETPLDDVAAVHSVDPKVWVASRERILRALEERAPSEVLLAYGVSAPTGIHRAHYLAQLAWLAATLEKLPVRLWAFGGRTTHPSRWQRVTTLTLPGVRLSDEIVRVFLQPITIGQLLDPAPAVKG